MSKTKYSLKELVDIKSDIESFFEVENEISTRLAYALNKNKRIIKDEIETLKEKLKPKADGMEEYRKQVHKTLEDCGAVKKMSNKGNTYLTDMDKVDVTEYEKELDKLDKAFEKELEENEKVRKENEEIMSEKVAVVDFFTINFKDMPEKINPTAFTDNIALLIKDDE